MAEEGLSRPVPESGLESATAMAPEGALTVIAWWREAGMRGHWFSKRPAFDSEFRRRFANLHELAAEGRLDAWAAHAEGALALLILLDQYPRNAFRGTPRMYATDPQARRIAYRMLDRQMDTRLPGELRLFCYLPLSHSEDPGDQARAVTYNRHLGPVYHEHALGHEDIIRRFGRFPHRNAILGRRSTAQELRFLADGGFAG